VKNILRSLCFFSQEQIFIIHSIQAGLVAFLKGSKKLMDENNPH
jgi:hypothetical protein